MDKYWPSDQGSSESFWEHEWGKHGTCISTLDPNCYTDYQPTEEVPDFFRRTVSLFKSLPSYDWLDAAGITPSTSKTYSGSEIQDALSSHHDDNEVYFNCDSNGALNEIWYFYNVRGSVQTGDFVPTGLPSGVNKPVSSCPSDEIKYLPKSSSSPPSSSASSTAPSSSTIPLSSTAPSSTPTGAPFSGKGYLNVITTSGKKGCIISGGTWYTTGTCATFTATPDPDVDGFNLKSSKGYCGIASGKLTCADNLFDSPPAWSADGTELAWQGSATFYADSVPSGTVQESVYEIEGDHAVSFSIAWQSI